MCRLLLLLMLQVPCCLVCVRQLALCSCCGGRLVLMQLPWWRHAHKHSVRQTSANAWKVSQGLTKAACGALLSSCITTGTLLTCTWALATLEAPQCPCSSAARPLLCARVGILISTLGILGSVAANVDLSLLRLPGCPPAEADDEARAKKQKRDKKKEARREKKEKKKTAGSSDEEEEEEESEGEQRAGGRRRGEAGAALQTCTAGAAAAPGVDIYVCLWCPPSCRRGSSIEREWIPDTGGLYL